MPYELLAHTVSHLKALISYDLEPRGQGHNRTRLMMLALFEIGFQDSVSLISNISFIFGHFSLIQPSKTILL